jgi:hypothetical protein
MPESKPRHAWVKVKEHTYLCTSCGTTKQNIGEGVEWRTKYWLPDGRSAFLTHVPPCAIGPKTEERLMKWAQQQEAEAETNADDDA